MSIKRIYNEFSQGFEDEYYIKLAQDDVMAVPALIDIMLDDDFLMPGGHKIFLNKSVKIFRRQCIRFINMLQMH